jgi:hypothetical protein
VIDLVNETVLRLADAAKTLPARRSGKRPHRTTLERWDKNGFRGIHLETVRVGDTLCTSLEALQRFVNAVTAATVPASSTPTVRANSGQREELLEQRLADMGL